MNPSTAPYLFALALLAIGGAFFVIFWCCCAVAGRDDRVLSVQEADEAKR